MLLQLTIIYGRLLTRNFSGVLCSPWVFAKSIEYARCIGMTNTIPKAYQMRSVLSAWTWNSLFKDSFCFTFLIFLEISQVVAAMREMVNKDTQNLVSNSFLLDDDLRWVKYFPRNNILYHLERSVVTCDICWCWMYSTDFHFALTLIFPCYSIPFSTEDLSMAIPAIDYADVDLPESLQHYTSVQFLLRQQDAQPVR